MSDGKYYWLKLKCDFFKRHDIRIIQGMDNGREVVLFYLKLLIESIDHEGYLRFSEDRPYTNGMLASLLETPLDIVELSMNTLIDFGLVQLTDDKTIFLPKLASMIGYETEWAKKKREYRTNRGQVEDKPRTMSGQCQDNVLNKKDNVRQEIELEKEIEIEKEIDSIVGEKSPTKQFKVPSVEEISAYCQERNNSVDAQRFFDYYESKGWYVGKNKMKDWKAAVRTWERQDAPTSHCPTPKKNNPYDIDWSKV